MKRGWTLHGPPTSFRLSGESAAAAAVGSGEEKVVLPLIRSPEGLNRLSTSPEGLINFLGSPCFLSPESSLSTPTYIDVCP